LEGIAVKEGSPNCRFKEADYLSEKKAERGGDGKQKKNGKMRGGEIHFNGIVNMKIRSSNKGVVEASVQPTKAAANLKGGLGDAASNRGLRG